MARRNICAGSTPSFLRNAATNFQSSGVGRRVKFGLLVGLAMRGNVVHGCARVKGTLRRLKMQDCLCHFHRGAEIHNFSFLRCAGERLPGGFAHAFAPGMTGEHSGSALDQTIATVRD